MSRFVGRHEPLTPDERRAVELLRSSDRAPYLYAEAVADLHLERLLEHYGLKESKSSFCVHTLTRGRRCRDSWGPCRIPGSDHQRLFLLGGKPRLILLEPYQIYGKDLERLVAFCKEHKIHASISNWPGLHFPGRTISIELTREGEFLEHIKEKECPSSASTRH